jgi:hypothetical protein
MAFGEALKGEVEDFAGPIAGEAFASTDDSGHEIHVNDHVHYDSPKHGPKTAGTVTGVNGDAISINNGHEVETVDHSKVHDDDSN